MDPTIGVGVGMTGRNCPCAKCVGKRNNGIVQHMVLCPNCGNKRCPHATNHALGCTQSNEPGQKGSAYA